jgi:glucose/arabinose dehydrogenase
MSLRARRPAVTAIVIASLVGACASGPTPGPSGASTSPSIQPSPSGTTAGASPSPSPAPPSSRPSPSAGAAVGDPAGVIVTLEPFIDGLQAPLLVTNAADGSDRLFIVEQAGRIRIARDGRLVDRPFLDITDRISAGGERGLLGLAFHPDFGEGDDRFFVDYTALDGDTVVASFRVTDEPDLADPASEEVLIRFDDPFGNHNGGNLAFGPDGMLYNGQGDGGGGGDPLESGQRLDTMFAKLLRIDIDGASDGRPYAIPDDNPFRDQAGAIPEAWAYGLRNPWRFSFDRLTGDLWIGDVGQGQLEEIDRALVSEGAGRGVNYGWSTMEGTSCFRTDRCDREGLTLPIAEYGHGQGCSVTGGYVYRGEAQPALAGVYLFADFCSGNLWGLASGGAASQEPVLYGDTGASVASFGEDEAGEMYAADLAGRIVRVVGQPTG